MKKLRYDYKLAMEMKYGRNWDTPLFHASTHTSIAEPEPSQVPHYIDDATEEKAEVFNRLYETTTIEEQRKKVLEVIKSLGEATDNDVARVLKVVPSTISARRNELRDRGEVLPVLDETGRKKKKIDPQTNQPNTLWRTI